jgi:hypothetical protein
MAIEAERGVKVDAAEHELPTRGRAVDVVAVADAKHRSHESESEGKLPAPVILRAA